MYLVHCIIQQFKHDLGSNIYLKFLNVRKLFHPLNLFYWFMKLEEDTLFVLRGSNVLVANFN